MNFSTRIGAGLLATSIAGMASAGDGKNHAAQSDSGNYVNVLAASALADSDIVTSDGKRAGEIEYLLIDGVNGTLEYAMIEEDEELELGYGEYVAVPFSSIKLGSVDGDTVTVNMSLDELTNAPRFNDDSLHTLTDPTVVTSVFQYFEPIEARAEDATASQQKSISGSKPKEDAKQTAEKETTAMPDEQSQPLFLVSERMVSSIFPGLDFAANYVGAEVQLSNGEDFGTIDQVMVNETTGAVSYYLVSHGGFLGFGSEWIPMPVGSLTWSPDEFAFRAPFSSEDDARKFDSIPKGALPTAVRKKDLDALYQAYDLERVALQADRSSAEAGPTS